MEPINSLNKDFTEKYISSFNEVFVLNEHEVVTFRNDSWLYFLMPYNLYLTGEEFQSLKKTLNYFGDSEIAIANIEVIPIFSEAEVICFNQENMSNLRDTTSLSAFDCVSFGSSKKWGWYCYSTAEYSIIAGDKEFSDKFIEFHGGLNEVKNKFISYAKDTWDVEEEFKSKILSEFGLT